MREANLPSPNVGSRGYHLRRVAAQAISQVEIAAAYYPNGKHPDAANLKAFFDACSAAAGMLSGATPRPAPGTLLARYTLPSNVAGGEAGKGFTCTGLARDPLDGSWWVGNDGRVRGGTLGVSSLVHLSPDFSTVLGEFTSTALGFPDGLSVQGVCMTPNGPAFIRKKPGTGTAALVDFLTEVSRAGAVLSNQQFTSNSADFNGVAYDSLRDNFVASSGTNTTWRTRALAAVVPNRIITYAPDQLFYAADSDTILTTGGSNGSPGEVRRYNASTLELIASTTLPDCLAIEGIVEVGDKWYITNDHWFHNGTTPNEVLVYQRPF